MYLYNNILPFAGLGKNERQYGAIILTSCPLENLEKCNREGRIGKSGLTISGQSHSKTRGIKTKTIQTPAELKPKPFGHPRNRCRNRSAELENPVPGHPEFIMAGVLLCVVCNDS